MQYSALISKPKSDSVFLRLSNIISYVLPCLSEQNMNINWHQFPFDIDPTPMPIARTINSRHFLVVIMIIRRLPILLSVMQIFSLVPYIRNHSVVVSNSAAQLGFFGTKRFLNLYKFPLYVCRLAE